MENNTVLFDNTIDIVMENCESISVNSAVIHSFRMETDHDIYEWDERRYNFRKTAVLKYIYISIDLGKIENAEFPVVFISRYINQANADKFAEQKEAIEILKNSDYISSIYINGEHFRVPWKEDREHPYNNAWEIHSEKYGENGNHFLNITISKEK